MTEEVVFPNHLIRYVYEENSSYELENSIGFLETETEYYELKNLKELIEKSECVPRKKTIDRIFDFSRSYHC